MVCAQLSRSARPCEFVTISQVLCLADDYVYIDRRMYICFQDRQLSAHCEPLGIEQKGPGYAIQSIYSLLPFTFVFLLNLCCMSFTRNSGNSLVLYSQGA